MTRNLIDFRKLGSYQTLTEVLGQTETDPEATAIIFAQTGSDPVTISRGRFLATARRYAHSLAAQGIRAGDLVLVAHDDTMVLVYCFWGLLLLGAVPSIYTTPNEKLDPAIYSHNIAALVREVDAAAFLAHDRFVETFQSALGCPAIAFGKIEAGLAAAPESDPPIYPARPDDLAYVQTSSGTTGNQRCVPTSHRMVIKQLVGFAKRMEVGSDDVIVNWMPLYHDGGLIFGTILPIAAQVPVVLISPLDWVRHPGILFKAAAAHRGTLFNMPNFAFNHLVRRVRERDMDGISLSHVRAIVNGSERVYHTSFERFIERFAGFGIRRDQLGVAYGLAENTLMAAHTRIGQMPAYDAVDRDQMELEQMAVPLGADDPKAVMNVSCGPPLDGVQIQIVGDSHEVLPERRIGQVAIRSESLFSGYYRRPEVTAHLFIGDWFLTGDMGYLADGELYIVGRLKDLIINGGKNLYPADIEEIVSTVAGVRPGRVVAFGVPDENEGTELIAVVAEVDAESDEQKAEIERQIRRAVTQETSLTLSFLDLLTERWIIKTSSGKTSRVANRRKWLAARPGR